MTSVLYTHHPILPFDTIPIYIHVFHFLICRIYLSLHFIYSFMNSHKAFKIIIPKCTRRNPATRFGWESGKAMAWFCRSHSSHSISLCTSLRQNRACVIDLLGLPIMHVLLLLSYIIMLSRSYAIHIYSLSI